jgi:hypothetical protein
MIKKPINHGIVLLCSVFKDLLAQEGHTLSIKCSRDYTEYKYESREKTGLNSLNLLKAKVSFKTEEYHFICPRQLV